MKKLLLTMALIATLPLAAQVHISGNTVIQGGPGPASGVSSINTYPGAFTFTGPGVSCTTTTCTFTGGGGGGGGVVSINSISGAYTFTGSGVSCTSTTCTFNGGGAGTVTSFAAPSGSWPTWLVPTVTNSTTTPSLAVAASAIPNSALANASTTVQGATCTLGSTCNAYPPDVTVSIGSFAIPANTCYGSAASTTPTTFTMTGVTTSMKISAGFTGNPAAINGWGATGGLSPKVWPSGSNQGSYVICNDTGSPITGGAITLVMGAQ